MKKAPIPNNENERLASLKRLQILDTAPEERFDRITKLATKVFNVPISTITLVDSNREWFKSVCGIDQKEGERAISFCGHAMLEDEILIIPDAKKDPRFFDNPMVIGEPFIRFYAGVPIFSADGARVGTFCIKGHKPRKFTKDEKEALVSMTKWVELEINTHNLSIAIDQIKKSVQEIYLSEEKFKSLVMNIPGTFYRCKLDKDWTMIYLSSEIYKLSGYLADEIIGEKSVISYGKLILPEDSKYVEDQVRMAIKNNQSWEIEYRIKNKDGAIVWCYEKGRAVLNNDKKNIFLDGVIININERKKKEEEMKILNKDLEKMNNFMINRELKMIELKKEIKQLKEGLDENKD